MKFLYSECKNTHFFAHIYAPFSNKSAVFGKTIKAEILCRNTIFANSFSNEFIARKSMFKVLLFMFAGIVVGYLFRKRKIHFLSGVILTLIWALLFLLGAEVGLNRNVVNRFGALGFEAFVVALASVLGSIVAAKILWGKGLKKEEGADER
jgi:uncharacterized membrane protein YbjE (DUF340 family)